MISAIKLEKYMVDADIFGIIVNKLYYKKKLCSIILFKINKSSKIEVYYIVLLFSPAIYLKIEGS